MANVHILSIQNGVYQLLHHIPVPAGNNQAGLAWQTAILRSGFSSGTTRLPNGDGTLGTITTAETNSITSGALYEYLDTFDPGNGFTGLTGPQKAAILDARIAAVQGDRQTALQTALNWYGFTR